MTKSPLSHHEVSIVSQVPDPVYILHPESKRYEPLDPQVISCWSSQCFHPRWLSLALVPWMGDVYQEIVVIVEMICDDCSHQQSLFLRHDFWYLLIWMVHDGAK